MKVFLALCFSVGSFALTAQSTTNSPLPPQPQKTMQQLFIEDQADLPTNAKGPDAPLTFKQYDARVKVRMQQIRSMLAANELKTGEEFYDAAFIFQHGDKPDDYLFAHILAMQAVMHGFDKAKWLTATTLDRYLQATQMPQLFGTQYPRDPALAPKPDTLHIDFSGRTMEPYNKQLLPDSVRLDFCVPSLAQQVENVKIFNTNKYPDSTLTAPGCKR